MWKKEYLIDWKLREVILDNFPQNTKQILPQHKGWQSLFLCTYRLHFKTVKLTIFTQRINFQNFYEISFRKMQQLKNNMTHLEHSTPMWDPSGELIIRHTVGFWQTSIRKKKKRKWIKWGSLFLPHSANTQLFNINTEHNQNVVN